MYNYLRVAAAVPKVKIGNTDYNKNEIIAMADDLAEKGAELIVFPELSVCSYTCADLFLQSALLKACNAAVVDIADSTKDLNSVIAIGAPLRTSEGLFNCAYILYKGIVMGIVPKTYIPNYNEFYEDRWFSSAALCKTDKIDSSELGFASSYIIPIGTNLIFDAFGVKFAAELCEDLWVPVPPSSFAAVNGAEIIINLSASNETIGKREYRRSIIKHQSSACLCGYVYASAGNGESSTDLIFSGYSSVYENGTCLAESKDLISDSCVSIADIDAEKIRADRIKLKTFSNSGFVNNAAFRTIVVNRNESLSDGAFAPVYKLPFVPDAKEDRFKRCLDIFEMQTMGLKRRADVVGYKPVIGVSGGLDSTLALLVCAFMMRKAGKPMSQITGLTLPCFGTTKRTHNNSVELMNALGITSKEIDIKSACAVHCGDIEHPKDKFDVTYENIQARERTQVLMDYACKIGGFVVGTGDLSELALGWCTYNADHMSMYGVNSSIPKTLIRWMIESVMECNLFPAAESVLADILDTPISPELLPPDEKGNITQETEEIIGPYALHDFFLYYMLRYGFSPDKIYYLAVRAFKDDFDGKTILKWEKVFYKRFFTQQFKRSCLPDGVKVGSVCLSPRGDWRMPSDASYSLWLDILDKLDC